MVRCPPRSKSPDPLFPEPTCFREAMGRLQHLVVGGAVDSQQFVIIDVERHSSKPLLQPVTPAKAGAAVGPAAPVPRAMPACAGMTAEGHPYFLSSSTDRKSTRLNSSH